MYRLELKSGDYFLMRAGVETYLDIEGAAKYLDVAVKTIRKWVLNREIPYHKIMKVIRFRVSEIEEWINTGGKFCPITEDEPELDGLPEGTEETGDGMTEAV